MNGCVMDNSYCSMDSTGMGSCLCKEGFVFRGDGCYPRVPKESTAGAICTAFGDPHFIQFSGHYYDYQGTCEHILVKSRVMGFEVQIRNGPCMGRNDVSCVQAIAFRNGNGPRFTVEDGMVLIEGQPMNTNSAGGWTFSRQGGDVIATYQDGVVIKMQSLYVSVFVPRTYFNKIEGGLCGTWDNVANNDYIDRQGGAIGDSNTLK